MTEKTRMVEPGDWVRFYQNGRLVIGEVRYVKDPKLPGWDREICTDQGCVDEGCVLETRLGK
jgi:hypothetical protein